MEKSKPSKWKPGPVPERALVVEHWPIERLVPYARNARTHSEGQVEEIARSIEAFGFANPILVAEDGSIIAGHGRQAAARKLRLAIVPVIVLSGLSDVQRRQLVLADNRIALNAGWDAELLKLELAELAGFGCDLKQLGFSKSEIASALNGGTSGGLTDENEIPSPQEASVSRPGDIWCLGSHRVACGDSTDAALVARLQDGASPNLMVTDPPYGVEYDPDWRHEAGVSASRRKGKVLNDDRTDWAAAWALFPGQVAYVWHAGLYAVAFANGLEREGFTIRSQIIWAKPQLVIGRGDYHWRHEPCWYAVRKKGFWTGDRKQTTIWSISPRDQDADTVHGTQKPVECMRRPMLNNSEKGDSVYDPFLGSGTSVIAAETVGRVCYGLELDPVYVDVIVRRWEAFTGHEAVLKGDERTFREIAVLRASEGAGAPSPGDKRGEGWIGPQPAGTLETYDAR